MSQTVSCFISLNSLAPAINKQTNKQTNKPEFQQMAEPAAYEIRFLALTQNLTKLKTFTVPLLSQEKAPDYLFTI